MCKPILVFSFGPNQALGLGLRLGTIRTTFGLSGEDICMIERESKSGEPDSQSTGHGDHAEHHASSGAVEIAAKKEKHNCLRVTLLIK